VAAGTSFQITLLSFVWLDFVRRRGNTPLPTVQGATNFAGKRDFANKMAIVQG
jgi:hypothetical protein